MPHFNAPPDARTQARLAAHAAATAKRRRKQPRYGRPAAVPQEHDGRPNRAERSAFIGGKIGFPPLYRRALLIGGRA